MPSIGDASAANLDGELFKRPDEWMDGKVLTAGVDPQLRPGRTARYR